MNQVLYRILAALVLVVTSACSDPASPASGSLLVTITTSGGGTDADGFLVAVDSDAAAAVTSGSATYPTVSAGTHSVTISDVDTPCTLDGEATRSVTVTSNEQATLTFAVTCTAS